MSGRDDVAGSRGDEPLRDLIETCPDAVVFIDATSRVVLFNQAATAVFRYERQDILGQSVQLLMPETYADAHRGYVERYEQTGVAQAIGRVRRVHGRRKDGEVFPMELSVTKLNGESKARYAAFIRDTSETERLEKALHAHERLTALGMSASILAHEIGNPLNNLFLQAQLLERTLRKDEHHALERAASFTGEIRRLGRLLEEFRSVGKTHHTEFEKVELRWLLRDVVQIHLRSLAPPDVEVSLLGGDTDASVLGHSDKLKQVLLNLCKNALEAMPGGGRLTIETETVGNEVLLRVTDTGGGIPEGVDIFEPFVSTKERGTGLGLPIVRQLVEAHRGELTWQSKRGEGTCLTITLPRHDGGSMVAQPEVLRQD
jgi:two-component system sensor kinase FixL